MTGIWAGRTGVRIPAEAIYISSTMSKPVLRPTQRPTQRVAVLFPRRLSGRGPRPINHPI